MLIAGCGHFHSGVGPDAGVRTIYIPPIKNNSLASNASPLFTRTLINVLQQKLPYKISTQSTSDAILIIEIMSLKEQECAVNHKDTSMPISFLEDIELKCSMFSSDRDREFFVDKKISAHLPVDVEVDFSVARDQAMSKIANILADRVIELITNLW
jgi:hypothetical protein